MADVVLWHFPVSHFNEKARWALDYKGVAHVRKALFLDYIPRTFLRTGQLSLPIVFFGGEAVPDSTRIIAELEQRYPEPPLYPADPDARRAALELEDFFDEELGHSLRTLALGDLWESDPKLAIEMLATGNPGATVGVAKAIAPFMRAVYKRRHAINPESRRRARGEVEAAFDRVEQALESGTGYLVGDAFSVADLTAAALFGPLVRPAEHEYPIPEAALPDSLREYRESLSSRPSFVWVQEMYRRHRGGSAEIPG